MRSLATALILCAGAFAPGMADAQTKSNFKGIVEVPKASDVAIRLSAGDLKLE